jgi:beta-glucosidase/6-phospho-beta-glucosidase/beta-galactosidase
MKLYILPLSLLLLMLPTYAQMIKFDNNFEFGVANAPVHVEEDLDDIWSDFANKGKVAAYKNTPLPHKRLEFWNKPEIEINLAANLGVSTFRVGIDWQRLYPAGKLDKIALYRYIEIIKMIKAKNMKVMLTLFHHSEPKWTLKAGGWSNPDIIDDFLEFSKTVFDALNEYVDFWITFNEPNVYILFSKVIGIWPPGYFSPFSFINTPIYQGLYYKSLDHMAQAHNLFYEYAHKKDKNVLVSIAHNTANYKSGGFLGSYIADYLWENMNFYFPNLVKDHLDYMGFNYYGAEYISLFGFHFSDKTEYNDAGRAIDPKGFYKMIKTFYKRYQKPIFITENGTADSSDYFRGLYIAQHLMMIDKAIKARIPIMGYIHWTLTDNFEWSDGYCPKFGLVAVERSNGLKRTPRESYYFYQDIINKKSMTREDYRSVLQKYKNAQGKEREMCRSENGKDGLDTPRKIPLKYFKFL